MTLQDKYQDVSDIDIESDDFKSLPAEIQHELLTELKERGKRLSRLNYKLPEVSFSIPWQKWCLAGCIPGHQSLVKTLIEFLITNIAM